MYVASWTEMQATHRIVCDSGARELCDIMLNEALIGRNVNKYYHMQLLERRDGSKRSKDSFLLATAWGRVGTVIGDTLLKPFPSMMAAKREFTKKFFDKVCQHCGPSFHVTDNWPP